MLTINAHVLYRGTKEQTAVEALLLFIFLTLSLPFLGIGGIMFIISHPQIINFLCQNFYSKVCIISDQKYRVSKYGKCLCLFCARFKGLENTTTCLFFTFEVSDVSIRAMQLTIITQSEWCWRTKYSGIRHCVFHQTNIAANI